MGKNRLGSGTGAGPGPGPSAVGVGGGGSLDQVSTSSKPRDMQYLRFLLVRVKRTSTYTLTRLIEFVQSTTDLITSVVIRLFTKEVI